MSASMARENPKPRMELMQGTLDMLILQTLQWGPQHGHGISVAIRSKSNEMFQVEHGSLYPALHRLERQDWIESEWGVTNNKQRAKFYTITTEGKKRLAAETSRWKTFTQTIARVMKPA